MKKRNALLKKKEIQKILFAKSWEEVCKQNRKQRDKSENQCYSIVPQHPKTLLTFEFEVERAYSNIARIANAVTITLYSRVTM